MACAEAAAAGLLMMGLAPKVPPAHRLALHQLLPLPLCCVAIHLCLQRCGTRRQRRRQPGRLCSSCSVQRSLILQLSRSLQQLGAALLDVRGA
jgi:hypothetical protein